MNENIRPETLEGISSEILIHFSRHAEKNREGDLTQEGRIDALADASAETNMRQSMVFGSEVERTRHTAALRMAGQQEGVTGEETFEELRKKVDKSFGLGKGSKVAIDENLNFSFPPGSFYDEYNEGIRTAMEHDEGIKWFVQESDSIAEKHSDIESSTYSRLAASVARIIMKYAGIAPRWDELANDPEKGYTKTMERFVGTSALMLESFLAKVIDLTKGREERVLFTTSVKNAFGYKEGFEVEIITPIGASEPLLHIKYISPEFTFDEDVPMTVIESMT
jgi:hypothetical protein